MSETAFCPICSYFKKSFKTCVKGKHPIFVYRSNNPLPLEIWKKRFTKIPEEPLELYDYNTSDIGTCLCPIHLKEAQGFCIDCNRCFCFESKFHFSHHYILFSDFDINNDISYNPEDEQTLKELASIKHMVSSLIDNKEQIQEMNKCVKYDSIKAVCSQIPRLSNVSLINQFIDVINEVSSYNEINDFNNDFRAITREKSNVIQQWKEYSISPKLKELINDYKQMLHVSDNIGTKYKYVNGLSKKGHFHHCTNNKLFVKLDDNKYLWNYSNENSLTFNKNVSEQIESKLVIPSWTYRRLIEVSEDNNLIIKEFNPVRVRMQKSLSVPYKILSHKLLNRKINYNLCSKKFYFLTRTTVTINENDLQHCYASNENILSKISDLQTSSKTDEMISYSDVISHPALFISKFSSETSSPRELYRNELVCVDLETAEEEVISCPVEFVRLLTLYRTDIEVMGVTNYGDIYYLLNDKWYKLGFEFKYDEKLRTYIGSNYTKNPDRGALCSKMFIHRFNGETIKIKANFVHCDESYKNTLILFNNCSFKPLNIMI